MFKFKFREVRQDQSVHPNGSRIGTKLFKPVLQHRVHIAHQDNRHPDFFPEIPQLFKQYPDGHAIG